jgi:hypothetical protein
MGHGMVAYLCNAFGVSVTTYLLYPECARRLATLG